MRFTVRLLNAFAVFLIVAGIIYSLVIHYRAEIAPAVLLFANAIFFFFISIMIKAAPAMEYMREHRESSVDRQVALYAATKEKLAPPPPPEGVHIPGPSWWPVALAAGATLVGAGLIFSVKVNAFLAIGAVVLIITAGGWAVQAWKEREEIIAHAAHDDEHAGHH